MGKAELLLKIGAEGGFIAVYGGPPQDPQSRFRLAVIDQTPTFLSEEEGGAALRRDSGWLPTWADLITALNRYPWPNLHVVYVHPAARRLLWSALESYAAQSGPPARASALERWRQYCLATDGSESIDNQIVEALRVAQRIAVLTGAGISAESGIPTFRDKQTGLWENFDAADLATPSAFQRDPALVWGWYEWRRIRVLRAQPNPAHEAIATMAERVPRFTLITQNVDDLHERAGSRQVLHLHGELARPYCESCRHPYAHPPGVPQLPEGGSKLEPPRCQACGARVRPGVVWFGESLPELEWLAALEAVKTCEVLLSVGTSAVVQPAASLIDLANRVGAVTVQINPNPTDADRAVAFALRGPAGELLPQLVHEAWERKGSALK